MEQLIDFHAPEVQAVLDTLLKDKSTGKNIIWATDPPEELQTVMYEPVTDRSQITTQQLGLTHYEVVLPRMMKQTDTQQQRTRKKGEVFSPAWVCNKMNNALDADWFRGLGAEETAGQFTVELPQGWQTVETPVQFPACKGRTPAWVQYVQSRRLEVTCGEAPFLASRYDAATGEMIPVARRIGILDRKLRVVSENTATEDEWRKYATHAVQSTYGYEYQGDNLLLARVNLLLTYAEHGKPAGRCFGSGLRQGGGGRDGCGAYRDPQGRYADDRGHKKVGAVPGAQGSAVHERVCRPPFGHRAGQVPQDHAIYRCTSAGKAPETGSPAERQGAGQGESTGFRSSTAEPLAGRTGAVESICTFNCGKVRKSFSIIVRGDVY